VEAVSSEVNTKARTFMSLAMQRAARVGQNDVANAIGVDGSTVSRFMSDEKDMARALAILAALGLKVVPAEMQCFPPRKVQLLLELARDHLTQLENVEQLMWD
jgi:uncharacterized protein (UPF0261 family)